MPDDRDLDERARAGLTGEPLTASVRDILDEHAETERRALEERRAEEAERERMERRKADEERTALRHTGGERRVRARRDRGAAANDAGGARASSADPRVLLAAGLAGVVLAGGVRRFALVAALAAAGWALYRRVLEPAKDPGVVLQ